MKILWGSTVSLIKITKICPEIKKSNPFLPNIRSSRPEVFLRKGFLKIWSKLTGEHPCRSVISIKLLRNFIEIPFRHGCSPVNLLHIFRTPFPKNTSGWLLLQYSLSVLSENIKKNLSLWKNCSNIVATIRSCHLCRKNWGQTSRNALVN